MWFTPIPRRRNRLRHDHSPRAVSRRSIPVPGGRHWSKGRLGRIGHELGAGLHVYQKGLYFVVLAQAGREDESLAKTKKLAEIVHSRIK